MRNGCRYELLLFPKPWRIRVPRWLHPLIPASRRAITFNASRWRW